MSNNRKRGDLPWGGTISRYTVEIEGNKYDVQFNTDVNNNDYLNVVKVAETRFGTAGYEVKGDRKNEILQNEITEKAWSQILAKRKLQLNRAGPEFYNRAEEAADRSGNGELFAEVIEISNGTEADAIETETELKSEETNDNTAIIPDKDESNSSIGIQPIPDGDTVIGYAYPLGAYENNNIQDHLIIEAFKYKAPQSQLATSFKMDGISDDNLENGFAQSVTKGLPKGSNIDKYHGLVKLPIPNELQMSNGISWGDESANAFTTAAFIGAADALADSGPNPWSLAMKGTEATGNIIGEMAKGGNSQFKQLASAFGAQFALGSLGINVDPGQMITRATGKAINPNLELLFNGPKLRNFSFNFLFAPNDHFEASEVRKIQKFLKKSMSPSRNSGNRLFIDSPDVFRIRFRSGNERIGGVGMMKICAMTKCAINYTPENLWMTYNDPNAGAMPVRSNMTCDFTELTPIFQDHYEDSAWGKPEFSDLRDLQASTSNLGGFQDNTDDVGF